VNGCGIASVVSVQVPGLHLSLKTNWNAGPERERRRDRCFGSRLSPQEEESRFQACQAGHFYTRDANRRILRKRAARPTPYV
jgi:hypothetical protein